MPVHEYACAPVADEMVCGGEQRCLADGCSGKCQNRDRQQQADQDGKRSCLPVVRVDQRSGPGKFGPQRRIENAPIRTDIALEQFLRLVDRLDDVVVDANCVGARNEVAQQDGLGDRIGHGLLKIVAGARPAELADDDFLSRVRCPQLVVDGERPLKRGFLGHAFPVGKDMGEDLVHGVDEFRMVEEGLPVICGRHRNRTVSLHAPDNFDEFGRGVLVP